MRGSWIISSVLLLACGTTAQNRAPEGPDARVAEVSSQAATPARADAARAADDAEGSDAAAEDAARIDAVYDTFSRAYRELDAELVANLYTEDALYLPSRGDILRGRQVIGERFQQMFAGAREQGATLSIRFERIESSVVADVAFDVGYYILTRTIAGQEPRVSRGKFTVVLKRQPDRTWRFHVDGYSPAAKP